jgi:hypothetical protein
MIYKSVDLFGNETINLIEKKKTTTKTLFDDYDAFVDKFAKTDTQAMAQMVKQRQLDKLGGVGALAQSSVS